jgi:hypothetical protein
MTAAGRDRCPAADAPLVAWIRTMVVIVVLVVSGVQGCRDGYAAAGRCGAGIQ